MAIIPVGRGSKFGRFVLGFCMALAFLVLFPGLAPAWYVNAKTSPASGSGTVTPAGNIYIAGTTGTSKTFAVEPAAGCTLSRVTLDGKAIEPAAVVQDGGKTLYQYTVPYNGKTWRYLVAYFAPGIVDISIDPGPNGDIHEANGLSLVDVPVGSARTLVIAPHFGYRVDSVTATDATPVENDDGTTRVEYSDLQADQSVAATFALAPAVAAHAGADVYAQGNGPEFPAILDGTQSSSNQGPIAYAWSGAAELVFATPNEASTTVYSLTAGTYTATLTITSGGIPSSDTAQVTIPTRAAFLEGYCTPCHGTRDPEKVAGYDASLHKTTGPNIPVACQTCHDPTDSKHYTVDRPTAVCQPCHALIPTSTHATEELAGSCVGCHDPHSTKASCLGCHGNGATGEYWPDGIDNNNVPEYAWADDAGSHPKHVAYLGSGNFSCVVCHPGNPPVGHYTDLSSGAEQAEVIRMDLDGDGSVDLWQFAEGATADSGTPIYFQTAKGNDPDGYFDLAGSSCNRVDCHSDGNFDSDPAAGGRGLSYRSAVWGSLLAGCDDCHGDGAGTTYPSYASAPASGDGNSHEIHVGLRKMTCAECHSGTADAANALISGGAHVNLTVEVSGAKIGGYAAASETCSSIACHGNTDAQWGASGCLGCHSVVQGKRVAVTGQFAANSHHVQGAAVTGSHCHQCHWEARSDGTIDPVRHGGAASPGAQIDLVIYGAGSRPGTYALGSTSVQYTADGTRSQIEKINSHCLGCHSDRNDTATPFGDGKTPKQYAWDGTSVGSRYSQTGTTPWGQYALTNTTPKHNQAKAYSAHGNAVANQGGWDLNENWPNLRGGGVNVACFDCHNSHGSAVAGPTASYASATASGAILKDTAAGVGGYAVTYRPQAGGSAENKNLRSPGASLCFDCHLNATGGTTPWGYQSTFGAVQQIVAYWDSPYLGPGSAGPQLRYPYKALNSFMGGHFGASSPLSATPGKAIGGLCTPCHDPHGVSPTLGGDQAYGVPLLKGTWMTSPYKEDVAPAGNWTGTIGYFHIDGNTFGSSIAETVGGITESDQQFAGLCLNCHAKSSLTDGATHAWKSKERIHESVKGWKTLNTPVKHTYTCSKCHSPHIGSYLPRLMVTNCLDPAHKGRVGGIPYPVVWGSGDAGSGRIPGVYPCHEGATANNHKNGDLDQSWNLVTPWYVEPALAIAAGPAAGSFAAAGTATRANITWTTNVEGTSYVDFGPTDAYGASAGNSSLLLNHNVALTGLANHATYHYRVRSATYKGQQIASADSSFYISLPPTVPTLIAEPDAVCTACPIDLAWNASTDPLDGGPIEYYAEVSTNPSFTSVAASSGWIAATNWQAPLATNTIYYWRVKSRDANHATPLDPASAWSAADSFFTSDGSAPQVGLISPADGFTGYGYDSYYGMPFQWNYVGIPAASYSVQVSTDPTFTTVTASSGWLATTTWTAWLPTNAYSQTFFYWRVQGRDPAGTVGPWSAVWSFSIWDYGASGSCPFLFTWDGQGYAFEADLNGAGKLGLRTSTGYVKPEPHDYYLLKNVPAPKDGLLELRLVEERLETDFTDDFRLYTVDLPADRLVFAEKPQAGGTPGSIGIETVLHTIDRNAPSPASAFHLNSGQDVTAKLAAADGDMLILNTDRNIDFTYQTLELDLGAIGSAPVVKIAMDAVSLFPDSPEGVERAATFGARTKLEVQDGTGAWVAVPEANGSLPKPPEFSRPYIFDLSNIWVGASRKVRFTFLFKTYIDWIRVDTTPNVPLTIQKVPMVSAILGGHGIDPRSSDGDLYQHLYGEPNDARAYMPGSLTRYGDVAALLSAQDDKFVIYGGGDELVLTFKPPVPPGEGIRRAYLVFSTGYYKDIKVDGPHTVEPLPFAAMSNFPYDPAVENYPSDPDHEQYRAEYNTRVNEE